MRHATSRRRNTLALLVALLAAASATPTDKTAGPSEAQKRVCGLLWGCSLSEPPGLCPAEASWRDGRAALPADRCQDARELAAKGLAPDTDLGFRVYSFLGHRHQIVYLAEGELPLSRARLNYLVNDLPLAAKLLSAFQKTPYVAEYVDAAHTRFKGSRGGDLRGEAELVTGATADGKLVYFGTGTSQLGFWKLSGRGLVLVSTSPSGQDGRGLSYRIRVIASPVNAVVNAFMKMGLFKSLVQKRIRGIVTDIAEASQKLEKNGLPDVTPGKQWTVEEKEKLVAFLRLP